MIEEALFRVRIDGDYVGEGVRNQGKKEKTENVSHFEQILIFSNFFDDSIFVLVAITISRPCSKNLLSSTVFYFEKHSQLLFSTFFLFLLNLTLLTSTSLQMDLISLDKTPKRLILNSISLRKTPITTPKNFVTRFNLLANNNGSLTPSPLLKNRVVRNPFENQLHERFHMPVISRWVTRICKFPTQNNELFSCSFVILFHIHTNIMQSFLVSRAFHT